MAAQDNGYPAVATGFAFIVGAIIGLGAVLLLAPQSGAETRKRLKTYAEKTGAEIREKAQAVRATFDTTIEQGTQFLQEKKSILAAAFEAGKGAMKKDLVS